ncbi:PREDICTED: protein regulator of cytokinesis 1 [Tinamus guttatus]|uniref:protein regulator of cytokinesis 1 n=1 Tax=Tinamus guttatus TaxID=94827 RepID=UPI00052EE981|nr:PREDICTED: protein regulator of cytokinesis 1 [Tinamus guttatus]
MTLIPLSLLGGAGRASGPQITHRAPAKLLPLSVARSDVTCDEWSFYLLPLDDDIISMELPEFFHDYFLEGDHRWINSVARALQLLSSLYGPFSKAYGIGRCAKGPYELWRELEEESDSDGQGRKPEIGQIFLMDRGRAAGRREQGTDPGAAGPGGARSSAEQPLGCRVSPVESLRLMCLLSLTESGLVPKDYRSLKSQYLQSYGPEHLLTFHNLKRAGLLTEQSPGETLTAVESRVSKLVTDRAAGKITDAFNSLARKSNFRGISKKLGLVGAEAAALSSFLLLAEGPGWGPAADAAASRARSEALASECVLCLTRALEMLRDIWEEIGILEEQRLERTNAVRMHLQGLLEQMIKEEEELKERLLNSIATHRKAADTLCRELQLEPIQVEEESTLLQLEKCLRTRAEALLEEMEDRKRELNALQEQDQDLCRTLCTTPFCIDSNAVPSLEKLECYRNHLASLAAEKERRQEVFVSIKRQIILCMEELDHTPNSSFEQDVVCKDEADFCLSTENLAALQDLLQQLEGQRSLNEALCVDLRSRIMLLWERLQVPAEEREASAVHMTGSRAKTRRALQLEVDRLEELKLQNLKEVIQATRAELVDCWDKCFYSQEQRDAFRPYYEEDYTETLLQLHDAEVGRVKRYYETHKDLFEAAQKWEENWQRFLELERKTTDPSRFANRGGALLKEEKQRAKLQKTLAKLQEELESRVQAYEQERGEAFLVKGQQFTEYVAEQWQCYHLEKEKEKQERHLKKSRQTETEMLYGSTPRTPIKRRLLGPHPSGKVRKVNCTTIAGPAPNSTGRSVLGRTLYRSPPSWLPPSAGKAARTPSRVTTKPPRPGHKEQNKENVPGKNTTALSGGSTPKAPAQKTTSINSVASTYSEFARELSKASRCDTSSRILNSTTTNTYCP